MDVKWIEKFSLHVNGWGATTIFVNGEKIY